MTERTELCPGAAFDAALGGAHCEVMSGGASTRLPLERWLGPPDATDHQLLLARCHGPTLDVGCGPGRLTAALLARGVTAVGIDLSEVAVQRTLERGATALRRDVFGPIPSLGQWHHVLLADGNVGIGGDPVRLLRRSRQLVRKGGTVVVELAAPGTGVRRERVRLRVHGRTSAPFDWANVAVDGVNQLAWAAGLEPVAVDEVGGRWAAVLRRPDLALPQVWA
ncbi:MAG: methyltransferase domain-containing protein [Actinomycetota bacterium]|nr:methyltransferase domain-containing protein [Actinomycetota bacterium]